MAKSLYCASLASACIRALKRAESLSGSCTSLLARLRSISGLVADRAWSKWRCVSMRVVHIYSSVAVHPLLLPGSNWKVVWPVIPIVWRVWKGVVGVLFSSVVLLGGSCGMDRALEAMF